MTRLQTILKMKDKIKAEEAVVDLMTEVIGSNWPVKLSKPKKVTKASGSPQSLVREGLMLATIRAVNNEKEEQHNRLRNIMLDTQQDYNSK